MHFNIEEDVAGSPVASGERTPCWILWEVQTCMWRQRKQVPVLSHIRERVSGEFRPE